MTWKGSAWATDLSQVVSSEPDATLHGHTPLLCAASWREGEKESGVISDLLVRHSGGCVVSLSRKAVVPECVLHRPSLSGVLLTWHSRFCRN